MTTTKRRFHDALGIIQGACNPSGIAHSITEARKEGKSATEDPAVRLMAYQLSAICGSEFGLSLEEYARLEDLCKAEVR